MNPNLKRIQHILRGLRLLHLVEGIRFGISAARQHKINAEFMKQNPDLSVQNSCGILS